MSEIDYEDMAQMLLDLEADVRAEGFPQPDALYMVKLLEKEHGPFDLTSYYGQNPAHWSYYGDSEVSDDE